MPSKPDAAPRGDVVELSAASREMRAKRAGEALRRAKVGVLMESLRCSPFLFETLSELAANEAVELHLLLHDGDGKRGPAKALARLRTLGVRKFANLACFRVMEALERRVFALRSRDVRAAFVDRDVDPDIFATTTRLCPMVKKANAVRYPEADVDAVGALDLDLILRGNARGIYKGRILSASKQGIISFHHGDNRWNRGHPPGFWEVYQQRPATGFIIQILNEKLDDGNVIFRGEVNTLGSYTENFVRLMQAANPFMARIIGDYAATGRLPRPYPKEPFSHSILKCPELPVTCRYALRTFLRCGAHALRRKVFGRRQRWSVGYVESDWQGANLSRAVVVPNPPGRFFADPFVVTHGREAVIFVEDFHFDTDKGSISAVRILPDRATEVVADVIREEFHMSFPYVFPYGGELYMVPETHPARAIRLYRCLRFPDRWEFVKSLMENVSAVDTMLFERGGRWWMLTNIGGQRTSDFNHLYAFSAENPLSTDWQPHRGNPLRSSAASGRNGGLLRDGSGNLFRVRQRYGFNRYGTGSSIARIERLDDDGYDERFYCSVEPAFIDGLAGTHHMHCNGRFTVFDFDSDQGLG